MRRVRAKLNIFGSQVLAAGCGRYPEPPESKTKERPLPFHVAVVQFLSTQHRCLQVLGLAFPEFDTEEWRAQVRGLPATLGAISAAPARLSNEVQERPDINPDWPVGSIA